MLILPKNLPSPVGMSKDRILELLLREEYGFLPPAPLSVTAEEVSRNVRFCAGKAELITLKLTCSGEFGDFTFPICYTKPTRPTGPVPCFIQINFRDLVPDAYLPSEEIVDNGFAVLSFCYQDITSDNGDFTTGLSGVVYPNGERADDRCGKIGLWAWAAMRVMDYAMTLPELDKDRISVCGHSRLGKTALLAGALDERFFCAFSNDSGCSGASLSREKEGETVAKIWNRFPYWFCGNFAKYADREDFLPFDQHFLLAANMPHRVYVASAAEDLWADPKNEYLSCVAADAYCKALGYSGFIHPDRLPEIGDSFHEGYIGYHLRAGLHYFSREDWQNYMAYIRKHM